MALVTAVAFLFRHDHGVYIGISMTGLIVLLDWGATSRAVSTFGRYLVLRLCCCCHSASSFNRQRACALSARQRAADDRADNAGFRVAAVVVAASEPVASLSRLSEQRTHVRWADEVEDAVRLSASSVRADQVSPDR